MNTIGVSLYALTLWALIQQPSLPDVQPGLPSMTDDKWFVGQVILFLTLIANLLFNVYDSRQKRQAELDKATQVAASEASRVAQIQLEAERAAQQRREDREEAERLRQWDREEAEQRRRWDLEDRDRARKELAAKVETTRENLERRVDKQQEVLVQKLDQNTELTINAAQESKNAAEVANHVNLRFVALAKAIDAVRGTTHLLEESHAAALIPEIKELSEDTNLRVRGLEEDR